MGGGRKNTTRYRSGKGDKANADGQGPCAASPAIRRRVGEPERLTNSWRHRNGTFSSCGRRVPQDGRGARPRPRGAAKETLGRVGISGAGHPPLAGRGAADPSEEAPQGQMRCMVRPRIRDIEVIRSGHRVSGKVKAARGGQVRARLLQRHVAYGLARHERLSHEGTKPHNVPGRRLPLRHGGRTVRGKPLPRTRWRRCGGTWAGSARRRRSRRTTAPALRAPEGAKNRPDPGPPTLFGDELLSLDIGLINSRGRTAPGPNGKPGRFHRSVEDEVWRHARPDDCTEYCNTDRLRRAPDVGNCETPMTACLNKAATDNVVRRDPEWMEADVNG